MTANVLLIKILSLAGLFLCWELLAKSGLLFEGVVPSIWSVVIAIGDELVDKGFYRDLGITMLTSFVGFLCGSIVAIVFGIVLGVNPFLRAMIEPFIAAIGGTPKIIFLPILFLIFGLGAEPKMAQAALSAFFPVILSTTSGFLQIPQIFLRVGRSFHLSQWQMVTKIYLPAMANSVLTGLRLGMAIAIIGVLAAEITYSDAGLGFRLIKAADRYAMASVYGVAVLIFLTAALINSGFTKLQDNFLRRGDHGHPSLAPS